MIFPLLSSLPDLPSASSYSCPSPPPLIASFFSALPFFYPLRLSSFCFLHHLRFFIVVTSALVSSPLSPPTPHLRRSRAHLGCHINSMLCNLRYVYEPGSPFDFFCVWNVIFFSRWSHFRCFPTLFTTFLPACHLCVLACLCVLLLA